MNKAIIFLILIALLVIFLYPKDCGYDYGGLLPPNGSVERVECNCLGYKYVVQEECMDCSTRYQCIGLNIGNTCFESSYNRANMDLYENEKEIDCPLRNKPSIIERVKQSIWKETVSGTAERIDGCKAEGESCCKGGICNKSEALCKLGMHPVFKGCDDNCKSIVGCEYD